MANDRASRTAARKGKASDKKQESLRKAAAANGKPAAAKSKPARRGRVAGGGQAGTAGSGRKRPSRGKSRPRPAPLAAGTVATGRGRSAPKPKRSQPRPSKVEGTPEAVLAEPGLSEEERIGSAKYLPGASKPRVFEEERFLFPESYGVNRVRLHVKDPEWLFAHWDVDPTSLATLRDEVGERAFALSRVTLRVVDTGNGGASVILLPPAARSWYVRTAQGRRSYRAELGVTLPSGEFRRLAESNTIVAPRGGPSAEPAKERRTYRQARAQTADATAAAARAEAYVERGAEPWSVPPQDAGQPIKPSEAGKGKNAPGGASDVFRR